MRLVAQYQHADNRKAVVQVLNTIVPHYAFWALAYLTLDTLWLSLVLSFIAGLFVGVSAFFAGMLNMSFGLAGSAGVNPLFFLFDVLLILAWRNAGYWGLDRFALPILGTPWEKGTLFEHRTASA